MNSFNSYPSDEKQSRQQPRHVRNDSSYSMDSFVVDMSDPQDRGAEDDNDTRLGVSGALLDNRKKISSRDADIDILKMTKGDSRRSVSMNDSVGSVGSDSLVQIAPVHSFFNQPYFQGEADESGDGGSIVFKLPIESTPAQQTQQQTMQQPAPRNIPSRDRFPSFDSLGSSGSLVKKIPSKQSSTKPPPSNTTVAPQVPRILPYHERRKLMQQRQKQQQQQQQRTQTLVPPRPDRQMQPPQTLAPGIIPYGAIPPAQESFTGHVDMLFHQQQPQVHPSIIGYPPNPSNMHFPPFPGISIYPPGVIAMQPKFPGFVSPGPPSLQIPLDQRRLGSLRTGGEQRRASLNSSNGSNKQQTSSARRSGEQHQIPLSAAGLVDPYVRPQVQSLTAQQQQWFPAANPEKFGGFTKNNSSSFDSSDDNMNSSQGRLISQINNADIPPPPPPPLPPPPLPAAHIRQESTGSVSSLGSLDRSMKEESVDDRPRHARNFFQRDDKRRTTANFFQRDVRPRTTATSFFQRLNPWAAKTEPLLTDFHRKNQAFLSTVERQNQFLIHKAASSSPVMVTRRGPPLSSGSHRRLQSIDNDDWTCRASSSDCDVRVIVAAEHEAQPLVQTQAGALLPLSAPPDASKDFTGKLKGNRDEEYGSRSSVISSDDNVTDEEGNFSKSNPIENYGQVNERTRLLPPSGISSNEYYDRKFIDDNDRHSRSIRRLKPSRRSIKEDDLLRNELTLRAGNIARGSSETSSRRQKRKKKKKSRRHKKRSIPSDDSSSSSSISSSSNSSRKYQLWMQKRASILEQEREKLIKQWKAEAIAEELAKKKRHEDGRLYRRALRCIEAEFRTFMDYLLRIVAWVESFFANLPLTIGAIALACANLGVDWFKFTEENLDSCQPVHFHSSQCTFPEFPGCFYCDTNARLYKAALNFHFICSTFAGVLALTFLLKLIIARRVVFDELSNPTMAAPAGLICMTLDVVFAGRGIFGMFVVCIASCVHLCLAIWFIYMALAYRMMPEPSWFPNTVGIGISAVKTWLYQPVAGQFIMAISLALNFFFFPISLVRVALNEKISAPVGWMQMSAPNISLYALTIMAQPSFEEELPDINNYQKVHRKIYLPCMHFLFALCLVGMAASLNSLRVRWKEFRKVPFSPAHAAFCCPTLSHANAVQAYRAAVVSFSDFPAGGKFRTCLYAYWITVLVIGTIVTICIATKFLLHLPEWTHIDVSGEIEPPAPYETSMTLTNMVAAGETLVQPYVSPAILQANETGALVLTRDAEGQQRYVRTRKVTAIGFEPMMNVIQMETERDILLDWVGRNPPRRRNKTLSVPGIDFNYRTTFGSGNSGVYTFEDASAAWTQRPRSNTVSTLDRFTRRTYSK